jgi:hypothetical protein
MASAWDRFKLSFIKGRAPKGQVSHIYELDGSPNFSPIETEYFALQGETSLPKGYFWSKPRVTQMDALASHTLKREGIQVGRSKNVIKGFASVVQLIFASITLYRARGSQLERYGYAAFGLSVFPYALMSLVNLVVVAIVGEYTTLFVLRTAILEEAKRCGGTISGEVGTLPEVTQSANEVESPIGNNGEDRHVTPLFNVDDSNDGAKRCGGTILGEVGTLPEVTRSANDVESPIGNDHDGEDIHVTPLSNVDDSNDGAKRFGGTILGEVGTLPEATQYANDVESPIGNDGEDRHVTPLPKVDDSNDGAPHLLERLDGEKKHGGEGTRPKDFEVFLTGKALTAANLRMDKDGVLVITMKGRTGLFKLIEGEESCKEADDDPLTYHLYVSAVTNQEKVPKHEELLVVRLSLLYVFLFSLILVILPYVFIFLLTNFRKGGSTSAQRGWMMSWLVFSQISSFFGFSYSTTEAYNLANPLAATTMVVMILAWSTPAIGGFVVVGRMLLEFQVGTCSIF